VTLLAAASATARAHTGGTTGYASIVISRGTVRYGVTLPAAALPPPLADALRLAQAGSQRNRDTLLDVLRTRIVLHADGTRCEPGPGQVVPSGPDGSSVTLQVDFACGRAMRVLSVEDDIFDVLGADHHTLARIDTSAGTQQFAFTSDSRQARFAIDELGAGPRGIGSFFVLGIHHILSGYDHLLFLVALLLRGGRFWSLLKIVTAFTVAHSITLSLAVLGVVSIPDRLVEAVIAGSIVWVAVENLVFRDAPARRWVVSFLFGLVHGFGFAAALDPLGLPPARLALALLGFNIGVETGQALVVALLLPVLAWSRGKSWEPPLVRTASVAVAVAGLAWLVERVFFA
jgi:hydrogenase/urease accessory protein HupE